MKLPTFFIQAGLCVGLCIGFTLQAQSVAEILDCYQLKYTEALPQDLLSERSACWIELKNTDSQLWLPWAEQSQSYFLELGLDVVAYAPITELYMGEEVFSKQVPWLRKRGVRYLVFLSFLGKEVEASGEPGVELTMVRIAQSEGLIEIGSEASQHRAPSLKRLYEQLLQLKEVHRIPHNNWLVSESVDRMPSVSISKGQHNKRLPPRLADFQLEVKLRCLPCQVGQKSCEALLVERREILEWFETEYTHNYKILSLDEPPGQDYVMYLLRGPRHYIDELLHEKKQSYSPEEAQEQVYAFYIKYLIRNSFFSLSYRGRTINEALAPLRGN